MPKKHSSRKLTPQQLRQKYSTVRHELSILKSKGLISKSANLKKAKPSLSLRKKAEILRPIIEDRAQAIQLPKQSRSLYKAAGYQTTHGYTIVPKQPNEKVVVDKMNRPEIRRKVGSTYYTKVHLPVNMRNFASFYEALKDDHTILDRMTGIKNPRYGFTFFGSNSLETGDSEWLIEYLQHYTPLFDPTQVDDAFAHLILYYHKDDISSYQWTPSPRIKRKKFSTKQDRRPVYKTGGAARQERYRSAHEELEKAKDRLRKRAQRDKARTHKFEV